MEFEKYRKLDLIPHPPTALTPVFSNFNILKMVESFGVSRINTCRFAQIVRLLVLVAIISSMLACVTQEKAKLRYVGEESIYPAVAYVFDLMSAKIIKADVVENEYVSSYIKYPGWGRINRFRFYVSIRDHIISTEIADVQIQVYRGGFESWQNDTVSSLVDAEVVAQNVTNKIIRAIKDPKKTESTKKKILADLNFNWIVLKDFDPSQRQQWVSKNMQAREYQFNSTIDRILKSRNRKKYGKYLVKLSKEDIETKSRINLQFYSNNTLYTRLHIGDPISVTGRLMEAKYSDQMNVLNVILTDFR
ncbi:MAG: hypothetical protein ACC707_14015 [Thiohalomonadales bacterium]